MTSLSAVGKACLVGGLGLAAADGIQEFDISLPTSSAMAALACTVAFIAPSYISAPTPTPQESEISDQPPSTTSRCIIPIATNGLTAQATLNEPECTALQESLAQSHPMTLDAFRVFSETIGISPENRLPWQNEFTPGIPHQITSPHFTGGVESYDLSQPAMWGIDGRGNPFLAVKYLAEKNNYMGIADDVMHCAMTIFQDPSLGSGRIFTVINPHPWCEKEPFVLYAAYNKFDPDSLVRNKVFTDNLNTLLQGQELRTNTGSSLTLDTDSNKPIPACQASATDATTASVSESDQPNKAADAEVSG